MCVRVCVLLLETSTVTFDMGAMDMCMCILTGVCVCVCSVQCEHRNSVAVWERDRERWPRQCSVSLPDGSCCSLGLQPGVPVRQLLLELCQRHQLNLAAVDLFLIGGEKVGPLNSLYTLFLSFFQSVFLSLFLSFFQSVFQSVFLSLFLSFFL